MKKPVIILLILAAIAAVGYFGWQQFGTKATK